MVKTTAAQIMEDVKNDEENQIVEEHGEKDGPNANPTPLRKASQLTVSIVCGIIIGIIVGIVVVLRNRGWSSSSTFKRYRASRTESSTTSEFPCPTASPSESSTYTEIPFMSPSSNPSPTASPTESLTYTEIPFMSPSSNPSMESICDSSPSTFVPPFNQANLKLRSEIAGNGSDETFEYYTSDIWAVWWDATYDREEEAIALVERLNDVRCRAISDLNLQDPPNMSQGYYFNIYMHHDGADIFPNEWGVGVGTDTFGVPFLTITPTSMDHHTVDHEGFHIFQWNSNSIGYHYSGDSMWYIEASANWYDAIRQPTEPGAFAVSGTILANPHLAMWHSFNNQGLDDPFDSWFYLVRQYGMNAWLYYMTEVAGFSRDIVTDGFYGNETRSPQEYLFDTVGSKLLRDTFADWAARNTADFDYMTREQFDRAVWLNEMDGDFEAYAPYIMELNDTGSDGYQSPPKKLAPRGWSYNVIKINNSANATYEFEMNSNTTNHFEMVPTYTYFDGRVVIMDTSRNARYLNFNMDSAMYLQGNASVTVTTNDVEIYFVVVAMPEFFEGNQVYDYEFTIERTATVWGLF